LPPDGARGPHPSSEVNTTFPLILNILGVLPCCGGALFGVLGIVFAAQAANANKAGDLATARSRTSASLALGFVSMGIGLVGWIAYFLYNFAIFHN
jgi:hypothetical protein